MEKMQRKDKSDLRKNRRKVKREEMEKIFNKKIFLFVFAMLLILSSSSKVNAATSKKIYYREKVGGYYYWSSGSENYEQIRRSKSKNGKGNVIIQEKTGYDQRAYLSAVTDGKYIYYGSHWCHDYVYDLYGNALDVSMNRTILPDEPASDSYFIYRCDMDGSNEKYLGCVGTNGSLMGYYKGKLILNSRKNGWQCRQFNIKTGKTKKIKSTKDLMIKEHSGRYYLGEVISRNHYLNTYKIYDSKNNKMKTLTKKGFAAAIKGNHVYYAEVVSESKDGWQYKFRIRRYDLKAKKTKNLSGLLMASGLTGYYYNDRGNCITSKSMVYYYNDKLYKYTYATKKSKVFKD